MLYESIIAQKRVPVKRSRIMHNKEALRMKTARFFVLTVFLAGTAPGTVWKQEDLSASGRFADAEAKG